MALPDEYTYTSEDSECEMRSPLPSRSPPRAERRKARKELQTQVTDARTRGREVRVSDGSSGGRPSKETTTVNDGKNKKVRSAKESRDHGMQKGIPKRGKTENTRERRKNDQEYMYDEQVVGIVPRSGGEKVAARRDISLDADESLEQRKRQKENPDTDTDIPPGRGFIPRRHIADIPELVKYFVAGWFPEKDYQLLRDAANSPTRPVGSRTVARSVESFAQAFLYRNGDLHGEMNTGLKSSLAQLAKFRKKYAASGEDLTEDATTKCIWEFAEHYLLTPTQQNMQLKAKRGIINCMMKQILGTQRRLRSVVQLSLPDLTTIDRDRVMDAFIKYVDTLEQHTATRQQNMLWHEEELEFEALRTKRYTYNKKAESCNEKKQATERGETRESSRCREDEEAPWSRQTKEAREPKWRCDFKSSSEPREHNANRSHNNAYWQTRQGTKSAWHSKKRYYGKTRADWQDDRTYDERDWSAPPSTAGDSIAPHTDCEEDRRRV